MNLSHSPIDINQPWDMMTSNASTWVRVCGPNSDKAFRLMTGVWRRQEIKTSGARLNKKSVRKRRLTSNAKFSLKNWKWQVLRKYEMPKECWHATIQKHWNKSVSLINASLVCWQHLCRPAGVLLNLKLPFLFDFKSNRGWKGTLFHRDRHLFLVDGPGSKNALFALFHPWTLEVWKPNWILHVLGKFLILCPIWLIGGRPFTFLSFAR